MKKVEPADQVKAIALEIRRFDQSVRRLRSLGIIRSQKVVADIGEWIAVALFDGTLAESKNQRGWDIVCGKSNVQVRAHAKADANRNQWTSTRGLSLECTEVAIVVLSSSLQVERIFRLPTSVAEARAKKHRLSWSSIRDYEVVPEKHPSYRKLLPLFAKVTGSAAGGKRANRSRTSRDIP